MRKETIKQIKGFLDINMQQFVSASTFGNDANIDRLLRSLQKKLLLKKYPYKIVCLDISHFSWKNNSGAISCMLGGFLNKSNYRQFKIDSSIWGDDYASIEFVINSYFALSSKVWKNEDIDLFVIDGGKWQLWIIKQIYETKPKFRKIFENTDFISIWKWQARWRKAKLEGKKEKIYLLTDDFQIHSLNIDYNALEDKLLLKLRDESHRFANRYRKTQWRTVKTAIK